jgi:Sec-independent protein translocase protein TatA
MLALFDNLSFGEVLIGGVLAVMMFGKNLPQAAAKAAVQLQRLRRQMGDLRKDMGIDEQIREAEREMRAAMAQAERQALAAERAASAQAAELRREIEAPVTPEVTAAPLAASTANVPPTDSNRIAPPSTEAGNASFG